LYCFISDFPPSEFEISFEDFSGISGFLAACQNQKSREHY